MQRRPPGAVGTNSQASTSPILTRKRSSLVSTSSPRTPTGGNVPLPFFAPNPNRNSSSSWNSSNCDGADDIEWEWKSEQIKLLSRTLDALPRHLMTPFNGPVPPSNLLDKIAKGVLEAKGPIDWPHSLRATRAKIVQLARKRANQSSDGDTSDTIAEEDSSGSDVPLQQTTNTGLKRPLYRQSSMDFMQTSKTDIKNNSNIRRLSHRLQRTERMLASPTHHPYARSVRSPPPYESSVHALNLSTPSSSTLSGSHEYDPRKSFSSMSSTSEDPFIQPINPRVRRIKRAETFTASSLNSPMRSLKRAPSYGGSSRNSLDSVAMSVDYKAKDSDVTSSDEEEKLRSKKAKKARMQASSPTPTAPPTPAHPPSSKPQTRSKTSFSKSVAPKATKPPSSTTKTSKSSSATKAPKPRANLRRNPSIIGPELPNPQPYMELPTSVHSPRPMKPAASRIVESPSIINNNNRSGIAAMTPAGSPVPRSPSVQSPPKSLRRSKGTTSVPRRALARKISFGSLLPTAEEENIPNSGTGCGLGLGSAFQLH